MFINNRRSGKAYINGGPLASQIEGRVYFVPVIGGTKVVVEVTGLPDYEPTQEGEAPIGPHGFHIHEKGNCKIGDPNDPFQAAGAHYDPHNQPHGNHAGDLPVIFSNNGFARMAFFTNKFEVRDIIDRTVIIHQNPDDYRSQPTGNAGKRLACGIIKWD
ncbi:MAG: superoxide dismutase family protein [Bacillota bacterium]